ncbi:MAG: hypothetical protein JRE63_10365 [Deltaproteobacteria bacterium]|nr:hypothetical protein [Deltaproteobacteria bacterium]
MSIYRKWFCSCRGKPVELTVIDQNEDQTGEATCPRCGASPSSDPKKTITYKDIEDWND